MMELAIRMSCSALVTPSLETCVTRAMMLSVVLLMMALKSVPWVLSVPICLYSWHLASGRCTSRPACLMTCTKFVSSSVQTVPLSL